GIPGLSWRTRKAKVHLSKRADGRPYVVIKGSLQDRTWAIQYKRRWVKKPKSKRSTLLFRVPLDGTETEVLLLGRKGKEKSFSKLKVIFPDWNEFRIKFEGVGERQGPKRFQLFLSLGPTLINYSESSNPEPTVSPPEINMTALTVKLSAGYLLFPPRWDVAFNTYFTALPLSMTEVLVDGGEVV